MIVMFMALSSLPLPAAAIDLPPTLTFVADDYSVDTQVVLTATAIDVLDNAGIKNIKIYEKPVSALVWSPTPIGTKNCNYLTTCVYVKPVIHVAKGNYIYKAVTEDKTGNKKEVLLEVHFEGVNYPPELVKVPNVAALDADEDEQVTFRVIATDPDEGDHIASYRWYVDNSLVEGVTGDTFTHRLLILNPVPPGPLPIIGGIAVGDSVGDLIGAGLEIGRPELGLDDSVQPSINPDELELYDPGNYGLAVEDGDTELDVIKVVVTDSNGASSQATWSLTWHDTEPENVAFTFTPQNPSEGQAVSFTGTATERSDDIVSWAWNFGDGTTGNGRTVQHTFNSQNVYQVRLTVIDDDGSDVRVTRPVSVGDNPLTGVTLTATPPSGSEPLTVNLACTAAGGNPPYRYQLVYGNGNAYTGSSSQTSVTRTVIYSVDGSASNERFDATCTVTDADGDSGNAAATVTVNNDVPRVTLAANPETVSEHGTSTLTCSVTGGNGDYTYLFLDEDDNVLELVPATSSASHGVEVDFDAVGSQQSFDYRCLVADEDDDIGEDTARITVTPNEPVVTLTANPAVVNEHGSTDLTCSVVGGDADYTFTLFEGTNQLEQSVTSGNQEVFTITYGAVSSTQNHDYRCVVEDDDGDTDDATVRVTVNTQAPQLTINAVPGTGTEPLTVVFSCSATGGTRPYRFAFDFDDATQTNPGFAQTAQTSMQFTGHYEEGTYTPACRVRDSDGDEVRTEVTDDITVDDAVPVISAITTDDSLIEHQDMTFEADIHAYDGILSTQWRVNGQQFPTETYPGTEQDKHVTFTTDFDDGAYYVIQLYVTDSEGDTESEEETFTVLADEPVVTLSADPTEGDEGFTTTFTCVVAGGNGPFTYAMDPDVPGIAIEERDSSERTEVFTVIYHEEGEFDAECTVEDVDTDSDSDSVEITVNNYRPRPELSLNVSLTGEQEPLDVEATCTTATGNAPFLFSMDFDDGGPIEEDPDNDEGTSVFEHNYAQDGAYHIVCGVTDDDLDSFTDAVDLVIADTIPDILMTCDPETPELEGVNVQCTAQATAYDNIASWEFDFDGDGTPEYEQSGLNLPLVDINREYVFDTAGTYTITFTAWDGDGTPNSFTADYEVLDNAPNVFIYLTPDSDIYEPYHAEFNCSTEGDIDEDTGDMVYQGNLPFTYEFDFGDGNTQTETDVYEYSYLFTHDYLIDGSYDFSCTITDADDDSDEYDENIELFVEDSLPYGTVTWPAGPHSEGGDYDNVTFTLDIFALDEQYSSYDGVTDYSIDFGDGDIVAGTFAPAETSTSLDIEKHYTFNDTYEITLTLTDSDGSIYTASQGSIDIDNNPLQFTNMWLSENPVDEDTSVTVSCGVASSANDFPVQVDVDFGNGDTDTGTLNSQGMLDFDHTYDIPGDYNVTCDFTDNDGDDLRDMETLQVLHVNPTALFNYDPADPDEGEDVQFNDLSVIGTDSIITWSWDFDNDGVEDSNQQNPLHAFANNGTYTVSLTVTDEDGSTDTYSEDVVVANVVPVIALSFDQNDVIEPAIILSTCTVTEGSLPVNVTVVMPALTQEAQIDVLPGFVLTGHPFDQDGNYAVNCTAVDADGDTAYAEDTIVILDSAPTADFEWSPLNPDAGQLVSFRDLSTAYDGLVDWDWDFNDDGIFEGPFQNMSTSFPLDGAYNVTLRVEDADGSVETVTRTVLVGEALVAPTIWDVNVSNITAASATVTWNTNKLADSTVDYGITLALGTLESDATMVSDHTIDLTGLAEDTLYYFNVTSCDSAARCTTVGTFNFTTPDITPPGPVTGLGEVALDENFIAWHWNDPVDADLDHVEIWLNGTFLENVAAGVEVYGAYGLLSETTYEIQTRTVDTDGNINQNWVNDTATTTADLTPPVITNVTATPTGDSALINWLTDDGSNSTVEFGLTTALGTLVEDAAMVADHTINLTGLTDGTLYYYNVTSCNNQALCSTEGPFNFTTPDVTAPASVTGLNETDVGPDYITWSWTNPADPDFDHIELWVDGVFQANVSGTQFNHTGLAELTTYEIQTRTVDADGNVNPDWVNDTATTTTTGFGVLIDAVPTAGLAPLTVQFNVTIFNGVAPFVYSWDFDGDGLEDSSLQDPQYTFTAGQHTVELIVTDANSDVANDDVIIDAQDAMRDIVVAAMNHSKENSTAYLYDEINVTARIENHGNQDQTGIEIVLQANGVQVDTQTISLDAGQQQDVVLTWSNASQKNYNTLTVIAQPVADEDDLSDNMLSTNVRVWSVDDIVSQDTRFILYWSDKAYLPIQNNFAAHAFQDLKAAMTAAGGTLAMASQSLQTIGLDPSALVTLEWDTSGSSGILTAAEGNNEVVITENVP